ncbi:MAG TPA: tetratricopeptide repeat protein [Terriglobales bacterium]|nr:tetratricopeptide repeat protein [Terriglobales bacterium]
MPPPSDAPTLVPDEYGPDAPTILPLSGGASPSDTPTLADAATPHGAPTLAMRMPQSVLERGAILAGRYEILQTLGQGGMGAVYKARDLEVDRLVALKVIRPELAKNPAIIDRFKQELRLSQRVTHRNVIRIYDLGEGDGVKFITMEYVEGEDLRTLIHERKKFPPEEAVAIMEQICLALDAAHDVGVIHRDLKPQNVMQDRTGRVLVMDFGLARTLEGDGMTQTGALVGTMEYMSPEQALAKELDQRSDIFSAGLIFYELLTGQMPYRADSALASLIRRTQERAKPISEHDASFPQNLSNIVSKCLERDPANRYQNSKELLGDLEAWQGKRAAGAIALQSVGPWGQTIPWHWIGGIAAVLILAVVGFLFRDKLRSVAKLPSANTKPEVALAILPFRNASQDPSLDWYGATLADMLSSDVGQSAHLRMVSPDRLHQVLHDLRIGADTMVDPTILRRVGDSSNADTVIWGQYAKFGDQIRIDANIQNLASGKTTTLKAETSEKGLPAAIDTLADSIRKNLALSSDLIKELQAQSFKPSTTSVEALRDYTQGVELMRQGKMLEAIKPLQSATGVDAQFALAFSKLSEAQAALGYDNDADGSSRKAVDLSDKLPARERYLILANRARVTHDNAKAIEYYENLVKGSPEDLDVEMNLGGLYEANLALDKARERYNFVLQRDPKSIDALLATGRVEVMSGNAQNGLEYFQRARSVAIQTDNQEQNAAALHALGVGYGQLNKPGEALRNLQEALTIRRRIGQKRGMAVSLNEIGKVSAQTGDTKSALASFTEALSIRREIGDKRGVGGTLLDLGNLYDDKGDHDKALDYYKQSLQIEREIGDEGMQAICLNNIGNARFAKGDYEDALTYFQQALQLREKAKVPEDIVDSVHNVAETSAKMGQFDQAVTQYMRALDLRRSLGDARGAAIESYSLGTLFQNQGRFGAALNSKEEALKTFTDLKDRTFWMVEILGGYGNALIEVGRGDEAPKYLEDALSLARELKNDGMTAQTLGYQGDAAFYRGEFKSAKGFYERAAQAAERTTEPDKKLIAKLNLAKLAVQEGRSREAIASLKPLAEKAEASGLKYVAVQCSLLMAEAMVQSKDYAHAKPALEQVLLRSDKLGLQPLSAKAHFLLATIARASGNTANAHDHAQQVVRLLEPMAKQKGAERVLQRSDLSSMYTQANRMAAK